MMGPKMTAPMNQKHPVCGLQCGRHTLYAGLPRAVRAQTLVEDVEAELLLGGGRAGQEAAEGEAEQWWRHCGGGGWLVVLEKVRSEGL